MDKYGVIREDFDFNMSKKLLKEKYEVSAVFYNNNGLLCRKNCVIKRRGTSSSPQVLVIMMNPGSCKPTEEYNEKERCICSMDATQKQIAILMEYGGIESIQIENLSDICEGNSEKFWNLYSDNNDLKSIFSKERIDELINLDIPIIFAWGESAMNLSKEINIEELLKNKKTHGYVKEGTSYYQRPTRQYAKKEDKIAWIKHIGDYIKKEKER